MKKLLVILLFLFPFHGANAQSIDYVIEVVADPFDVIRSDLQIEIVTNNPFSLEDFPYEKWEVVGFCSNPPNLKIEIKQTWQPIDLKVEIVKNPSSPPDKKVCVTNTEYITENTLRILKLKD